MFMLDLIYVFCRFFTKLHEQCYCFANICDRFGAERFEVLNKLLRIQPNLLSRIKHCSQLLHFAQSGRC